MLKAFLVLVALCFFVGCSTRPDSAKEMLVALQGTPEQLEIFSLETNFDRTALAPDAEFMQNYLVLGKCKITDPAEVKQIFDSMADDINHGEFLGVKCFNPHHAIRMQHEKNVVDLVLCYKCKNFQMYVNDKQIKYAKPLRGVMGVKTRTVIAAILEKAKIPLSPYIDESGPRAGPGKFKQQ